MKITIGNKGRRPLTIPLPFWLLTVFINRTVLGLAMRSAPESARAWLGQVDAAAIRKAMRELKGYKGLELVRVDSPDGTNVRIVL